MTATSERRDARKKEYIRLYQTGLTLTAVGNQFGVSCFAVFSALREAGIPRRHSGEYIHKTDRTKELQIRSREMKKLGLTYQEIADQFHVSRQRIQQLLQPSKAEKAEILRRVNGRCEACGAKPKKLDLHHDTYDGAPTRVLCTACHKIIEPAGQLSSAGREYRSQWLAEIKATRPELFESITHITAQLIVNSLT